MIRSAAPILAAFMASTLPMAATAGPGAPGPIRTEMAVSTLGSLLPYRAIAADTLAIVDKGDIPGARARIKDLETQWDKDEAALKPKDTAAWTEIDKAIDNALATLRAPSPKPDACAASLKALIARLDGVGRA